MWYLDIIQLGLLGFLIWGLWPTLKQRARVANVNRRNRAIRK